MRSILIVILFVLLFLLMTSGCSDKSVDPDNPANPYAGLLDNVTFVPASGPPGTIVEIQGLAALPGDTNWTIYVGGQFAPLIRESGSSVYTVIPIFFSANDSTWPSPPPAPVSFTIHHDDLAVDSVLSAITVDSLPHATGAADSLVADLAKGTEAIRNIALSLGIEDTLLLGTCDAMEEILYTSENSLTAILNGSSPLVSSDSLSRELFSALLASSGLSGLFSIWADTLEAGAQKASSLPATGLSASDITDEQLATKMQLHQLINDFGNIAIGNTAITWQQISAIIGAVGVAVPSVGYFEFIVSFVVAELDFVVNKLVVAAFPSEITEFTLELPNDTLHPGDTTCGIVYISAKNNPPNITPLDIVQQVVGGMRLVDWLRHIGLPRRLIQQLGNFDQVVQDVLVWFIGVINNVLSTNYNAPTLLDVSLPHMTWDSVLVQNPGLIDLMSPNLSRIDYMAGSFNGFVKDSAGIAPLQMRTQPPGPTMYLRPELAAAGYSGGAFGDDLELSDPDTVLIVPQLLLDATLPSPLMAGASANLQLQTEYGTSSGGTRPARGVAVTLSIVGGTAVNSSGVSSSTGEFTTAVTPDSGASDVTITIAATDSYGTVDTIIVSSPVNRSSVSNISFDLIGRLGTSASVRPTFHGDQWLDDNQHSNHNIYATFPDSDFVAFSAAIGSDATGSLGYANAQLSCDASCGITGIDSAVTWTGQYSTAASIAYSVVHLDSAAVSASSHCELVYIFRCQVNGNAQITVQYDCQAPGWVGFDGNPYMIEMPASSGWSTSVSSGNHEITFSQTADLSAGSGVISGESHSDNSSHSGSITIMVTPL